MVLKAKCSDCDVEVESTSTESDHIAERHDFVCLGCDGTLFFRKGHLRQRSEVVPCFYHKHSEVMSNCPIDLGPNVDNMISLLLKLLRRDNPKFTFNLYHRINGHFAHIYNKELKIAFYCFDSIGTERLEELIDFHNTEGVRALFFTYPKSGKPHEIEAITADHQNRVLYISEGIDRAFSMKFNRSWRSVRELNDFKLQPVNYPLLTEGPQIDKPCIMVEKYSPSSVKYRPVSFGRMYLNTYFQSTPSHHKAYGVSRFRQTPYGNLIKYSSPEELDKELNDLSEQYEIIYISSEVLNILPAP